MLLGTYVTHIGPQYSLSNAHRLTCHNYCPREYFKLTLRFRANWITTTATMLTVMRLVRVYVRGIYHNNWLGSSLYQFSNINLPVLQTGFTFPLPLFITCMCYRIIIKRRIFILTQFCCRHYISYSRSIEVRLRKLTYFRRTHDSTAKWGLCVRRWTSVKWSMNKDGDSPLYNLFNSTISYTFMLLPNDLLTINH
jgi:hypothetical protein